MGFLAGIMNPRFDKYAYTSSSIYFFLFAIFLGMAVSGTPYLPGGDTALTALRIIFLVLPIIFFGKLAHGAIVDGKKNMSKYQLILLMVYFVLVFLFLCAQAASNTEALT